MADKAARIVFSRNLGKIPYLSGMQIQHNLARTHLNHMTKRSCDKPRNIIYLCEHSPVYTIGIRNKITEEEKQRLENLGAEFHITNRGGLITFHGPGQLMCYPVLDLSGFRRSVRWYVGQLEETLVETCRRLGVAASTTCDTGVWVGDNKIAAIGIHVSRWITTHGIALNCNNDPHWFDHILACGIVGKGVTSLSKEANREINVTEAAGKFLDSFSKVFDCEIKSDDEMMMNVKQ